MNSVRRRPIANTLLAAVGAGTALLPPIHQFVSQSRSGVWLLLLGDIALVGLVAAGVIIACRRSHRRVVIWAPWIACGALVGAGLIGPLWVGPYVLVAALSFGVVAARRGLGGLRGTMARANCVAAAALVNFACLWPFTLGQHRPSAHAPYLSKDLRAHTLLADLPLHDVWVAHLSGGGSGRTLLDLNEAMVEGVPGDETVALVATIAAYFLVARVLGLATAECVDTLSSMTRRLTDADRARSVFPPGGHGFVYHFEREAVLEIQTCAADALYVFALEPEYGGYALYWGVYARHVSRVTPYYMKLIDPVRRFVVYPAMLQRIEHRWRVKWRTGRAPDASERSDFGQAAGAVGHLAWQHP